MEHRELAAAAKELRRWRSRKTWRKLVMCLAAIVVFCTTYALILPAITMEQETLCGIEAHTHSDVCYTSVSQLVCTLPECPAHTHTEACYASEQVLVCTEDHEHTEECYETQRYPACGLEETEGHTHTEECYETGELLTCGREEHIHTEACYPEEEPERSGLEDSGEAPAKSDPNADLETQADWEASLRDVELTGDWSRDLVAVAESQLGYTESTCNFVTDEAGALRGYTRYGAWYGDPYGDWCAMFASFCLYYAEVADFPLAANCGTWVETLSREPNERYHEAGTHTPEPGDLVFFDWNDNDWPDHVGIVAERLPATEHEPERLRTIEGNSDNQVREVTCFLTDDTILGYAELPEEPPEEIPDEEIPDEEMPDEEESPDEGTPDEETAPETTEQSYEYEDDTVVVSVSLAAGATMPEDAVLAVRPITDTDDGYEDLARRAEDALDGEAAEIVLLDISFFTPDQEYIPVADTATVSIRFKETVLAQSGDVSVLHYDSDTEAPVALEQVAVELDGGTALSGLTFQTEGFSVFAVVTMTAQQSATPDVTDLDGKTFAIVCLSNGPYAMQHSEKNESVLSAISCTVTNGAVERTVDGWTFKRTTDTDNNTYYIFYVGSEETNYLKMTNSSLRVTTTESEATPFVVAASMKDGNVGKVTIAYNGVGINHADESTDPCFTGYSGYLDDNCCQLSLCTIGAPEAGFPVEEGADRSVTLDGNESIPGTASWAGLPAYDTSGEAYSYYIHKGPIDGDIPAYEEGGAALAGTSLTVEEETVGVVLAATGAKEAAVTLTNTAGTVLPQTGGAGTRGYTIGGLLLMAAAGYLLFHKTKRRTGGDDTC